MKGIQKWTGRMEGNFNTASNTLWSAAVSYTPSNFYLYPQRSVTTNYYYGTVWVKLGSVVAGGTTDKAKSSVSLIGDSALSKN